MATTSLTKPAKKKKKKKRGTIENPRRSESLQTVFKTIIIFTEEGAHRRRRTVALLLHRNRLAKTLISLPISGDLEGQLLSAGRPTRLG